MNLPLKHNFQVLYLIVLSSWCINFDIEAQQKEKQVFTGKVVQSGTKIPVPYVMILNAGLKQNALCDSLGQFTILALPGDTLVLSRLGYYQKKLKLTEQMLSLKISYLIEMKEQSYDLSNVNIKTLGNYQEFKYEAIYTEVPMEGPQINPTIVQSFPQKVIVLEPQARIPLGSPITALYNLASKEGKSLRKLAKEQEKDREIESYKDKYSPEVVSRLTGLKELELEKFMKYCSISVNLIKESTEYDIAALILEYFKKYKAEQETKDKQNTNE